MAAFQNTAVANLTIRRKETATRRALRASSELWQAVRSARTG